MASFPIKPPQTVVLCYELLDLAINLNIEDYTEGISDGNNSRSYKDAQRAQGNYLLDEVSCQKGLRILDIGCGNGTLLELVREREATGIGITISQPQVERCKTKGLAVFLMNYKDIPIAS